MTGRRGGALIMALVVVALIAMVTSVLVATNRHLFGASLLVTDRTAALNLGQGGLNRLIQHLSLDSTFSGDLTYGDARTGYRITFAPSDPYRSVNNLNNLSASSVTNVSNAPVPPRTADVVVTCSSDGVTRRLRFVLKRGVGFVGAMGASGRIEFGNNVTLSSITSIDDPTPVEARFHSNDHLNTGLGISWDGSGVFDIQGPNIVSSSSSVEPAIAAAHPNNVEENIAMVAIPTIDIQTAVASASAEPAPTSTPGGGLFCQGKRYLSGPQVIGNDIVLSDGSLYIDGDLTILGGVQGQGSVYVTGDVTIQGGNASVISNQRSGAAIHAEGDIIFEGLDAGAYLDYLAATEPTVAPHKTGFESTLSLFHTVTTSPGPYTRPGGFTNAPVGDPEILYGANYGSGPWTGLDRNNDIWWLKSQLGTGYPAANRVDQPLPLSDGAHAQWGDHSIIKNLRDSIEALPTYSANRKAQQVVRGLDELGLFFREGFFNNWADEASLLEQDYSLDHLTFAIVGWQGYQGYWYHPGISLAEREQKTISYIQNFFRYNDPLDLSWLGRAYFQGVLYSNGNVRLLNDATVIGSVVCDGDLQVLDGARFVYNAEYSDLIEQTTGPLRVVSFSEL